MAKVKRKYSGLLATPSDYHDRYFMSKKLDALLDHYEIDRNDPHRWRSLSASLAWEYVPHFSLADKRGRKVKPQKTVEDLFLYCMLRDAERQGKSINATVRRLVSPRGCLSIFTGKNAETLRDRYYMLKNGQSAEYGRMLKAAGRPEIVKRLREDCGFVVSDFFPKK